MWSVLGAYKICCVRKTVSLNPTATLCNPPKSHGQANELARLCDQLDGQRVQRGGGHVRSTQGLSSIGYILHRVSNCPSKAFHHLGSFTYNLPPRSSHVCSASAPMHSAVPGAALMMALASSSKDSSSLSKLATALRRLLQWPRSTAPGRARGGRQRAVGHQATKRRCRAKMKGASSARAWGSGHRPRRSAITDLSLGWASGMRDMASAARVEERREGFGNGWRAGRGAGGG
jgi:hypothetical protein